MLNHKCALFTIQTSPKKMHFPVNTQRNWNTNELVVWFLEDSVLQVGLGFWVEFSLKVGWVSRLFKRVVLLCFGASSTGY